MMSDFTLQRLISILLLLTAVDAFSSSARHQIRSRPSYSCRSLASLDLFGRKNKLVQYIEDDSDANNSNDKSKRGGILKKEVKKLNWLSPRQSTENNIKSGKTEDRHAWKKKNNKKYPGANRKSFGSIVYRWRGFRQKIRQIVYRNTIYVLECENDKYYVGSTRNRKQRYRQHFENPRGGSKWTRRHKPIRVIAEYKRIPTRYLMGMESQKTAEYMMKYGVNNVRGAAYCLSREFTTADIPDLTGFLGHYNQLDYRELYKELQKVLPRPDPPTSSFPPPVRNNYKARNNNNNYSNSNNRVNNEESAEAVGRRKLRNYKRKQRKKQQALKKDTAKCYKCGQIGHWASECPSDGNLDNQTTFNNRMEILPRTAETSSARTGHSTSFEETLDKLFEPESPPSGTSVSTSKTVDEDETADDEDHLRV